jgi:SPP1 family predicted phage head-tail adaptor
MIYSGQLAEILEFYKVVETQSESGYKSTSEVFMFRVRAERTKNKETYLVDADELFHSNELTFRLRYRKEIEETNIVVYRGQRYRITSIDKYIRDNNQLTIILAKINE